MSDKKPYIFISYAHKDKKRVLPVIAELQERGYAVWYDAGIEAGSEWPRIIAEKLSGCAMMIAFVSENYVLSDNCQRELTYAQTKKKPILTVFDGIDRSELPLGMDMQLGLEQSITRDDYLTSEEFVNAIVVSSIFREAKLIVGENAAEKPKPTNPRRTRLLSLILVVLEFCALPVTIRGLAGMSGDFGTVFLRAFLYILMPQIALMILGIILARPLGKGLVDEERANAAAWELIAMFVVGVIAICVGVERMSEYNGFVRFIIAFVSVAVSDFIKLVPLCYSYMKY